MRSKQPRNIEYESHRREVERPISSDELEDEIDEADRQRNRRLVITQVHSQSGRIFVWSLN